VSPHHPTRGLGSVVSSSSWVRGGVLYSAERAMVSVCCTKRKKPEATHHKFQRRLLGISWKDKVQCVRNEAVRQRTNLLFENKFIRSLAVSFKSIVFNFLAEAARYESSYRRTAHHDTDMRSLSLCFQAVLSEKQNIQAQKQA